ncbi:hypothetical protein Taro_051639 [Colocasia esculenta]|uniref:Coatomer subunit zeta n=1 Tax=Colocasia esculenta TaxID=4460 RepID=A0A843XGH8_COLES|nr:hypothetical protein [Colocasia esculenta]
MNPLMKSEESCPSIKNILLLDSEGKRVAVKYFSDDWPTLNAKLAFEKSVFTKTQKTSARTEGDNYLYRAFCCVVCRFMFIHVSSLFAVYIIKAEITMFDNYIVVYKFIHDLHFYVTAGDEENELILATVLQGFFDAVGLLLRNDVEKRTALENLDLILLCIDEIVDGGYAFYAGTCYHPKMK